MIPDQNAVMWKINFQTTRIGPDLNLDLDMIGFISKYGGDWQWWYPYPKMDGKTTDRDTEVENVSKHIGREGNPEPSVTELVNGKPGKHGNGGMAIRQEILACKKYTTVKKETGYIFMILKPRQ